MMSLHLAQNNTSENDVKNGRRKNGDLLHY